MVDTDVFPFVPVTPIKRRCCCGFPCRPRYSADRHARTSLHKRKGISLCNGMALGSSSRMHAAPCWMASGIFVCPSVRSPRNAQYSAPGVTSAASVQICSIHKSGGGSRKGRSACGSEENNSYTLTMDGKSPPCKQISGAFSHPVILLSLQSVVLEVCILEIDGYGGSIGNLCPLRNRLFVRYGGAVFRYGPNAVNI